MTRETKKSPSEETPKQKRLGDVKWQSIKFISIVSTSNKFKCGKFCKVGKRQIIFRIFFLLFPDSNPIQLAKKRECYLCAAPVVGGPGSATQLRYSK